MTNIVIHRVLQILKVTQTSSQHVHNNAKVKDCYSQSSTKIKGFGLTL